MSSDNKTTKYSIPDDHWDDDNDEEESESAAADAAAESRTTVRSQTVEVVWEAEPRDLKYRVHIAHGENEWEPMASHARRAHRIDGSNQWDPYGEVDWADLPMPVREAVAERVAGVESPAALAPQTRIVNPEAGRGGEA